jgi:hypothetical protein
LKPTDVALIATALVEAGRFANAVYDGEEFEWDQADHDNITKALSREVDQVQEAFEGEKPKKAAKVVEEEAVTLSLHLKPSIKAGEAVLGNREDLKTLFADIVVDGVEYLYSQTDIGWQWTLERVNWATLSQGELRRRIKFKAEFEGGASGFELGPGGKKKVSKK